MTTQRARRESQFRRSTYYRTRNATIYEKPAKLPTIYIAGAGPVMARYARKSGDGFICTSGKSPDLYSGTLLPNVAAGMAAADRTEESFERMIEMKVSYDTDGPRALDDTRGTGRR